MGSGPEFRLLGPLEVRRNGHVVPIRAGKHRTLLACLLLRSNRVVPIGELVEALWGDHPPARIKGTLQTYVMRLRQALGDPSPIHTTPDGYLLAVPPNRIDVHRFATGAELARQAVREADLTRARAAYAETMALWRGPALADVPSEALSRDEVPRLTELMMRLHEERTEVELALGNHEQLVPVLRGLTNDHPWRERFWGQLMLALYRSSRQAEALEVFRQVDRMLHEQLGIDPSEDLRAMHQSILVGDPRLAAPAVRQGKQGSQVKQVEREPVAEPGSTAPSQLPYDLTDFVGRAALVDRITRLLAPGDPGTAVPIVTLSGGPGIGKTALAVHVAHRLRPRFPDGQLYVDLRGYGLGPPTATVDVLSRFLRALGVPPEQIPLEVDEQSSMFRSLLTGRRMLLVLDNASAPDQVRPLLPGASSCPVLVTSRDDLRGLIAMNGARRVPLDVLEPAESVRLLGGVIGQSTTLAEPGAVEELVARCAHLPLALRVAAANVASRPDRTVAEYLAELPGEEPLAPVDLAYGALPAERQRLFRLLSLVPGPDFTAEAAANVADVEVAEAAVLLADLAATNLLQEPVPGRYQFHDELMLFAALRRTAHDGEPDQAAARSRLLEFYVRAVDQCAELLYPDVVRLPPDESKSVRLPSVVGPAQALRWLDAERANLTAAIRSATEHGPSAMSWRLADGLRGYLSIGKHVTEWLATAEYGLHAAYEEQHRPAEAAMHQNLGTLHWKLGDFDTSVQHYTRALELHRHLDDADGEAEVLNNLGLVRQACGDLGLAKQEFQRCLELKRAAGGPASGRGTVLISLGMLALQTGDLAEAGEHLGEALRVTTDFELRGSEATCRNSLGMVLRLLGKPRQALEHLGRALEISVEDGFREGSARVLVTMAAVRMDLGEHAAALELTGRALDELRECGDQQTTTNVLFVSAECNRLLGKLETADEQHQQSLTKARRIGYQPAEARALVGLAATRRMLGELTEARELCEQALALVTKVGLRITEGLGRTELAAISLAQGDQAGAELEARLALEIQERAGHLAGAEASAEILAASR